jgi:hypothetical protein
LILKYNQIGCLLDSVDEDAMRDGDAAALANAKLIVAEMPGSKARSMPSSIGRRT